MIDKLQKLRGGQFEFLGQRQAHSLVFWQSGAKKISGGRKLALRALVWGGSTERDGFSKGLGTGRPEKTILQAFPVDPKYARTEDMEGKCVPARLNFRERPQALSLIFLAEGCGEFRRRPESWSSPAPVWEAAGSPIFFPRGRTQGDPKNHFTGVLRAQGHGSAGQREGGKRAFSGGF